MTETTYHKITDAIGYGLCDITQSICVFNHTQAVACSEHPCQCGNLSKPVFFHKKDEDIFITETLYFKIRDG